MSINKEDILKSYSMEELTEILGEVEILKTFTDKEKIKHYLLKIRKLTEIAKFCPFCGYDTVLDVGHTTNNELVYVCLKCRKGFLAVNIGDNVVKGG